MKGYRRLTLSAKLTQKQQDTRDMLDNVIKYAITTNTVVHLPVGMYDVGFTDLAYLRKIKKHKKGKRS